MIKRDQHRQLKPSLSSITGMPPPPQSESACAVIVTFNPGKELLENLYAVLKQVSHVIIVDNASSTAVSQDMLASSGKLNAVRIVSNRANEGVGAALNQGFGIAASLGYEFALALDQDSRPMPGMVTSLLAIYQDHPRVERIAIVVPVFHDPDSGIEAKYARPWARFLFRRGRCQGRWMDNVTTAISSGSLYRLSYFQELGGFREDLFIDYVDTEYCLRARTRGYELVVACEAGLRHKWGNVRTLRVGSVEVRPTFHAPERWYYISRNRIDVLRNYGFRFPHFLLYDLLLAVWWFVRMLLFEDRRLTKTKAVIQGTLDGLRGRMGPMPGSIED